MTGGALGWAEELGWGAAAALLCQDKKGGNKGCSLGKTAKWAKRERKGMARWAGLPRTKRKEEVGVGIWLSSGRDSGGGEVFFLFFFLLLLIQNLFQIHFKIYLKYFQTLVKITHLKNKMH